jgi:tetratricopeptide (TPR) repeat protein
MSDNPVDIAKLWDFGDPAASEQRFQEVLQTELPPDLRLEVQTQIARTLGLRRKFDEARALLVEVAPSVTGGTSKAAVRYWLELGRVENSSGNPQGAIPHFLKALELATNQGEDFLAVDAAHMLGIAEKGDTSLEWNLRAIEMAQASSDEAAQNWLGSLLNNTAWTYHSMGRYDEALPLFERAVEVRKTRGQTGPWRIARYCVGRCLRSMGRFQEALQIQEELEREHREAGNQPGFVYEEIGECLLALGQSQESQPWFTKAYDVLSLDEWIKADEPQRLERIKELRD